MAIVLFIVGCLLSGLIMPLSQQREEGRQKNTVQLLEEIRDALIGYMDANSALPCPASATSNGRGVKVGLNCTFPNGFVPYADLGLQGNIVNGTLVDPWQAPFRYRLTAVSNWQYANTIPYPSPVDPNLTICRLAPCNNPTGTTVIASAVAVLFSTGKDGADSPASTSPDQVLNLNGGNFFINREVSEDPGREFNDVFIWITKNTVMYELSKTK